MPSATPFVEGLIDEILTELPFSVRLDMLLYWAAKFATEGYMPDPAIVEIIGTLTTLDFNGSCKINEKTFPNLVNLPFSSSLTHINLSNTPVGQSQMCINTLADPIFQHLVSLNLHNTTLMTIDPLFNATFPKLHTLNLSGNWTLPAPTITTTRTKFPNLKVLDLAMVRSSPAIFEAFSTIPPPTTIQSLQSNPTLAAKVAPFQLEKLALFSLSPHHIHHLSTSPHFSQLKELDLKCAELNKHDVVQLFDQQQSVVKNLTSLSIGLDTSRDLSVLSAIAQSPLLSNLTRLELWCADHKTNLPEVETNQESIRQFINSPFLWNPKLKHLVLYNMPPHFVFDDLLPILDAANVKLETLDSGHTEPPLRALSTASCLSDLHGFEMTYPPDLDEQDLFETFIQSPFVSNLEILPSEIVRGLSVDQLVSMLSSPNMSNNLIELDLHNYGDPVKNVIITLCTQRIIPGDESSPLKFGKLRKLNLSCTHVDDDDVKLVVMNLTQLTHLVLNKDGWRLNPFTDKTITALLSAERADPFYPSPSLPNLIHLSIRGSKITHSGLTQLSQSQLLDQLEYLDVSEGLLLGDGNNLRGQLLALVSPGLQSLLTTSVVSNLKYLKLVKLLSHHLGDLQKKDEALLKYLDHCHVEQY
jgi:hypothetical protein